MAWEVDWSHPENTGTYVMARNSLARIRSARDWHLTSTGYLRAHGIQTPTYRADSWEVDWNIRNEKMVWARNPASKMPEAREWHWIAFATLKQAGIAWRPKVKKSGRYITSDGYVMLTPRGMTELDVQLADEQSLWAGGVKRSAVLEHRLVAAKKFGQIRAGFVVRHVNGVKTDNRPENLVLGSTAENQADHNTARIASMYWHNKYDGACREIARLKRRLLKYEAADQQEVAL